MYWFNREFDNWKSEEAWSGFSEIRLRLARTPLQDIVDFLDRFGKSFALDEAAVRAVMDESGLTREETLATVGLLPVLLSRESLLRRVRGEFGQESVLDRFTKIPRFQGEVKASPLGLLLHVTAGNVFISCIDSLLTGFVTKNLSIVKVSSNNKVFPLFFAKALARFDQQNVLADTFGIVHWKGGDRDTETFLKAKVQAIVAWGGEEVMESYRRDLPLGVKFLDFGPKISLQVLTRNGLKNKALSKVCDAIVADIIPWDQAACSSPQNLYVEEGVDQHELLKELSQAFARARKSGDLSEDEATEVLKEYYRGLWSELMEDGAVIRGENYLLHVEKNAFVRPSPLNRSVILKTFTSPADLFAKLEPFAYYLQSCSYLLGAQEKSSYLDLLALTGLKRFAPLGTVTWGMDGAPHDGRFVLRELVHFIGDEKRVVDYGEDVLTVQNSATLKSFFDASEHPAGYIFSSGGTTGEPKYVHFSYEEFDATTDLLAENLRAQGVRAGTVVANLFVAGNLWSSFMAMEKALEKIGAVQLPIGGLCVQENILSYLVKFKPEVVLGIPSLLVGLAEFALTQKVHLTIPTLIYAGEALSTIRQDFLQNTWNVSRFSSAGYASVDAGVIGYQCDHCGPGEHHVFSDLLDLKIIEDEAVVTSLLRTTMPVVNYRTGDRVEWIPDCSCGRTDKRFRLLGRIDNVIQIWSCRLLVNDIEATFAELSPETRTFQIILSDRREHNLPRERMTILYEGGVLEADVFFQHLYERSRDLKDTITLGEFLEDVTLEAREPGGIERNARTGKLSVVKDFRH